MLQYVFFNVKMLYRRKTQVSSLHPYLSITVASRKRPLFFIAEVTRCCEEDFVIAGFVSVYFTVILPGFQILFVVTAGVFALAGFVIAGFHCRYILYVFLNPVGGLPYETDGDAGRKF